MSQLGLVVNLNRCMDIRACMGGCKHENNVVLGSFWIRTYTVTTGDTPANAETYFIPIMCQHCRKPACLPACPKEAIYKRADGIVLIDKDKCTDCADKACMGACPYSAISFNEEEMKAEKCTLCSHLIDQGKAPICVATCNARTYTFGDLDDPNSEASQLVQKYGDKVHYLKPEAGTEPSVGYILTNKTWQDMENLRTR